MSADLTRECLNVVITEVSCQYLRDIFRDIIICIIAIEFSLCLIYLSCDHGVRILRKLKYLCNCVRLFDFTT